MTIWVDAQLSPVIASWIQQNFPVDAFALRDIVLCDHAAQFQEQFLKSIVISNSVEAEETAGVIEADLRLRLASLVQSAETLELKPG